MITVQKEHDFSLLKRRAAEIKAEKGSKEKGSKVFVDIFEFFVNFKQGFFCDVDSGREVP